jgi:protocatechuate 3,4-dioxygenase beta subunit
MSGCEVEGRAMLDRRSVIGGLAASAITQRALATSPLPLTPQEIVGPFYPEHPLPDHDFDLTHIRGHSGRAKGEIIEVIGRVLRPDGTPIRNAAIEVWQANAAGKYRHPDDTNPAPLDADFQGYGRFSSAADGGFRLLTVKPGAYPAPVGLRTPHIHFDVQSADCRFVAQMYFPGEPLNATDAFLSTMTARHLDPALLIAHQETRSTGAKRFRWDVVLRS